MEFWNIFLVVAVLISSAYRALASEGALEIINGKPVSIKKMPYMAALECYDTFVDGAFILSDTYVATYSDNHPDYLACQIRTGTSHRLKGGTVHQISESFCFNGPLEYRNNICIDQIADTIDFDESTQAISVSDRGISPGDVVTIGGWGVTSSTGPPSSFLRAKKATIVDMETCFGRPNDITSLMCTKNGTISFGDFGGPVVHNGKAIGLVIRTFPDFHVSYDFYLNLTDPIMHSFIKKVIGK